MAGMAIAAAAACAATAPASSSNEDHWTPDPEAQFLLDVTIRNLTIGDGVRAYQTPQGACVLFGDFTRTLDFPVKTDLALGVASGWAFNEKSRIEIDRKAQSATINGKRESFATSDIRDSPDGWCVDQQALGRWFGMTVEANVFNSILNLSSERKLPVEEAMKRRQRGESLARKQQAALAMKQLPRISLPYRMWRAPAFEFVVNAGVRFTDGKMATGRDASIYAAGEVAAMSYSAHIAVSRNGLPQNVWARLYRSDPEGGLLGPLRATHFALGDVPGLSSTFHSPGANGRGVVVTNRPLSQSGSFDRTEFRGRLPDGWDAELYRNNSLVGFDSDPEGTGEYVFRDVEILSGNNEYEVILHGPQGQIERVSDYINVSQDHAPPGKLWYWAGVRQSGEKLIDIAKLSGKSAARSGGLIDSEGDERRSRFGPSPEAAFQVQYGLSKRMSVTALVRSVLQNDERVTYAEGSVRRTIGASVFDVAASVNTDREVAARAQLLAKVGAGTLSASSTFSNRATGTGELGTKQVWAHRLGAAAPLKLGKTKVPISASVGLADFADGSKLLDGTLRLGARIGRFNLANAASYQRLTRPSDSGPKIQTERLVNELIGSGRVGPVRLRGTMESEILPTARLRGLALDAFWSQDDRREWDAGIRYDALTRLGTAQLTHIRRFKGFSLALTGEAQSNGSVGARLRLNFSLDPFHRGLIPTRERLASSGLVRARVFEDINENGRFDDGEPVARHAAITTGTRQSDALTDDRGTVTVGGLAPFVATAIGIDQTSLDNPALAPLKPVQVVVPRPGVAATIDIALVGGGSIEAFAAKVDGSPFEGVDFELVEADGTVLATARSDLDGYIVFENIHYGSFTIRMARSSASAIRAAANGAVAVTISRDKPAARIGAITVANLE